ncbi:MAG: hypothetical protein WC730_01230 [Patescibacteria group bacterium]|jgi:hypothetical protein
MEEKRIQEPLKFEVFEIEKNVEEIRDVVVKMKPKSMIHQLFLSTIHGIFEGFGFIIGTTIVAGIAFLLLRNTFESFNFKMWIGDTISQSIETIIHE